MSDLVKRLRDPYFGTETSERNLMNQAAARIEKLEAALRDALSYSTIGDMPVTIYKNARAALEERA